MNKPLKESPAGEDQDARTSRFEMRMSPYVRKVVKRAAEIQGRSMGDFVAAAAEEAAERAIREAHIIELTIDDQRRFAEAMLKPPEPGPGLRKAAEAHRRLVRHSE